MLDRADIDPSRTPLSEVSSEEEEERALVCAACDEPITSASCAIEVAGAHAHVFMNPAGYVFEIGCFSAARGAAQRGPPSDEWSWFPGHVWTTCVCRRCAAHVGWSFVAKGGGARFWGLILERLREG